MEAKVSMKRFLTARDVAERMQVSVSMAYKIIRKLNLELNKKGFLTVSGKVSRTYFEDRLFDKPEKA